MTRYCMLDWDACAAGKRVSSYDWECMKQSIHMGYRTVYNDGDSVFVTAPKDCTFCLRRKLTKKEAYPEGAS